MKMTYEERVKQWLRAMPKGEIKLGEHTLRFRYEWDYGGYAWVFDTDNSFPDELWDYLDDIKSLCKSTWHDHNHIDALLEVISKNPLKQGETK